MSVDWPVYKVADLEVAKKLLVQDGNHGEYRPRKNEFVESGTAFIRAADLGSGAVKFDTAEKINDVAFKRICKGIGKDFDTILSTKGTVGKIAFVPEGSPQFVCSPQTSFWRSLDHDFIDPKFIYYELQSNHFLNQTSSRKGETDMADYLSLTSQRGLNVRVPDITLQREVASTLGILDDKIEINRQINQTLEQIAHAIFKSWFVDFEPVKAKIKAKAAGRDPERAVMCAISGKTGDELDQISADHRQQLAATVTLFPDELVDSELGLIPKGWDIKPLDEIAHYQNGLALQKFRPEDDNDFLPVVKIAQLKKGVADSGEKASSNIKPECIIDNGDVVFSWSGSLMVDIWCGGRAALNQHLFKVTSSAYPKWFYLYWTKHHLEKFQQIAADKAVTMGHIKRSHLNEALCAVPSDGLLGLGIISDFVKKNIYNKLESFSLETLRNELLPKLLSGDPRLNVRGADGY